MRKTSLLLVVLTLTWLTAPARGQTPPPPGTPGGDNPSVNIFYSQKRSFGIPFGPLTQKLRSLQLFVSTDKGQSWQLQATALPDDKHFRCSVDRDGYYWFTVRTIDMDNRPFPPSLDGAQPSIKVVVDTQPPVVILQPLPPRGGEVGVSWDIRDENLDMALADAVRLEYRQAGTTNWVPVTINSGARQHYWNPQTTANLEVRLKARDRAGNWGEASTVVGILGNNLAPSIPLIVQGTAPPTPPEPNVPVDAERRFVNSTKITLNYGVHKVGASGISQIDLWYTLDGRTWIKYDDLKFGSDLSQKSVTFDVAREGVYGISLIARSGVGLGERPPQTGDRPQIWLEVDGTKPVVQLHTVAVGQGVDEGKLTIAWTARDKNLEREPITISYAVQQSGPWTPIAQRLANTGRYVWAMPKDGLPFQFYVKVEAIDRARNVGEAVTPEMIRVDLSRPEARVDSIEPAGK